MDELTMKLLIGIVALLSVIFGGALISKKIRTKNSRKVNQRDINITGNNNKVIGGDDNSEMN